MRWLGWLRAPEKPTRQEQIRLLWTPILRMVCDRQQCMLSTAAETALLELIEHDIAFGTPTPLIILGVEQRVMSSLAQSDRWMKCVVDVSAYRPYMSEQHKERL